MPSPAAVLGLGVLSTSFSDSLRSPRSGPSPPLRRRRPPRRRRRRAAPSVPSPSSSAAWASPSSRDRCGLLRARGRGRLATGRCSVRVVTLGSVESPSASRCSRRRSRRRRVAHSEVESSASRRTRRLPGAGPHAAARRGIGRLEQRHRDRRRRRRRPVRRHSAVRRHSQQLRRHASAAALGLLGAARAFFFGGLRRQAV